MTDAVAATGPDRVREAVVAAACRLFAERGIHAVSVREIAREVGVSHTLLHLYFGSKEEIVRQVLDPYDGQFAVELAKAPRVDEAVGHVFRQLANDRDLTRVLAAALVEGIVPDRIDTEAATPVGLVERLQAQRESDDGVDPRVLSVVMSATAIGWAVAGDWLAETVGLEGDREAVVDQVAAVLEKIVRDCT
jgi:AcrR family transcriptional regulator